MSSPSDTPSVTVLGLGGTIAMSAPAGASGVAPALATHQLLAAVPGLAETDIRLAVEDFRRVPGACLTFDDIGALAAAIRDQCCDADGVVVP